MFFIQPTGFIWHNILVGADGWRLHTRPLAERVSTIFSCPVNYTGYVRQLESPRKYRNWYHTGRKLLQNFIWRLGSKLTINSCLLSLILENYHIFIVEKWSGILYWSGRLFSRFATYRRKRGQHSPAHKFTALRRWDIGILWNTPVLANAC